MSPQWETLWNATIASIQSSKIMHTKISITPQMREFNDAVQEADALTDGRFDQEPAVVLLERLHQMKIYPHSARHLAEAIAGIAVKR